MRRGSSPDKNGGGFALPGTIPRILEARTPSAQLPNLPVSGRSRHKQQWGLPGHSLEFAPGLGWSERSLCKVLWRWCRGVQRRGKGSDDDDRTIRVYHLTLLSATYVGGPLTISPKSRQEVESRGPRTSQEQ